MWPNAIPVKAAPVTRTNNTLSAIVRLCRRTIGNECHQYAIVRLDILGRDPKAVSDMNT